MMSLYFLSLALLPFVSVYPVYPRSNEHHYRGQAFAELAMRSVEMDAVGERVADQAAAPAAAVAAATSAPVAINTVTIIVDVPPKQQPEVVANLPKSDLDEKENDSSGHLFGWLMLVFVCSGIIFICEKADFCDPYAIPSIRVKKVANGIKSNTSTNDGTEKTPGKEVTFTGAVKLTMDSLPKGTIGSSPLKSST